MKSPLASVAPARRRQVYAVLAALLVVLLALGGWAIVRATRGVAAVDQGVQGPVILVPGYGGDVSDLDPLVAQLRTDGRDAVVYQPTGNEQGDLRVQARRLASLARSTIKSTGAPSVDVIGYSAGGVIARLFVRDEGGDGLVRRVMTLGSPHHGTDVVETIKDSAGGCPTACEQLDPGSSLLAQLNAGDETPAGPRWIALRTTRDTVVTPITSARLDGALNILVQDVCPQDTSGHGGLPGDPVVLAAVVSALDTGSPKTPADAAC